MYPDLSGRRRRRLTARLIIAAAVAGLLLVVALWLSGGALDGFRGVGGPMTELGRLSGLIASYLLLIQVLLMARIPWLEGIWGQDVLARQHRLVGFTSFHLMLVHIVTITLGYAAAAQSGVLHEVWLLVTVYPGMLLATAGTLALVAVVVTSIRAARRRMRYESWHLIHLYAYLGVALALPHQLWTGADFTASPVATVFWWGLWGASALALLLWRFVTPLVRSLRHRIRVLAVVPESRDVVSIVMAGTNLDRLGLQAGQFCQWRFLGRPGWTRAHPFTVSATAPGR
jgi:predicted ferric reductase